VAVKTLTCKIGYLEARTATPWWKAETTLAPAKINRILEGRENAEALMDKDVWDKLAAWVGQEVTLPVQMARAANDPTTLTLPGESEFPGE
jgi:hypothetical protein